MVHLCLIKRITIAREKQKQKKNKNETDHTHREICNERSHWLGIRQILVTPLSIVGGYEGMGLVTIYTPLYLLTLPLGGAVPLCKSLFHLSPPRFSVSYPLDFCIFFFSFLQKLSKR